MTREQWAKLTPEEQRIKVAELCGWKKREDICDGLGFPIMYTKYSPACVVSELPDYLNDLNAMHEAVMSLSHADRQSFNLRIREMPEPLCSEELLGVDAINATAAQRAEAFVLTLEGGAE